MLADFFADVSVIFYRWLFFHRWIKVISNILYPFFKADLTAKKKNVHTYLFPSVATEGLN
jgi:hypothetical protein